MNKIFRILFVLFFNFWFCHSLFNFDLSFLTNPLSLLFKRKPKNEYNYNFNNINYTTSTFINIVSSHGYTAEEYMIQSQDGYNLCLHRISGSPYYPKAFGKKVVYMQHGLLSWTVHFVLRGPGRDLAFILADAGYDVWMGNVRGTPVSRSHKSKSPENRNFWEFTYHETALYDLSAFIDASLQITQQNKLAFIGYSLGTTQSFVLFSSLPEYNKKVSVLIELAPVVYWRHNNQIITNSVHYFFNIAQYFYQTLGLYEIFFRSKDSEGMCNLEYKHDRIMCSAMISALNLQIDFNRVDKMAYRSFSKTFPVGSSLRTFIHLSQNRMSDEFKLYDYGKRVNRIYYGSDKAPKYPLHQIYAPVALIYGPNDLFTADWDIEDLRKSMPNVIYVKKIPNNDFQHIDFILAEDAKSLVYDDVLSLVNYYSQF